MEKQNQTGKLIVIEGMDGSGKKTQADLLLKALSCDNYNTSFYDFPQYDSSFFGAMTGRYLDGEFGEADDVNPYLTSLMYAGDRFEAAKKISNDLELGKIVITNRYTQSNAAFQAAKFKTAAQKKKFFEWLKKLETEVYGIPPADLIILLYVPYKIGRQLVAKKVGRKYSNKVHDIHEKNKDFMKRVENEYLNLAKNRKWRIINCVEGNKIMPIEMIAEKLQKTVKRNLK